MQELAKIRYDLCPRHLKDKQFWRIYFLLAKSYISQYALVLTVSPCVCDASVVEFN